MKQQRTHLNRREFLASTAIVAVAPNLGLAATPAQVIEARPGLVQLVDAEFGDYPETEIWGFDGGVPGPTIRAKQGTLLKQELLNNLSQPTSIHWHGLRVPNAMDGVPGMTQDAVQTGERFLYEFPLRDAGTYWYHSHNQSTEQVARGLYGVVVVEEETPPDVDHDIVVVLDDWRLGKTAQITEDFEAMHDWTHAGRLGNYIHAHLTPAPVSVREGDRLRFRFVNVATDRIIAVSVQGGSGQVVARDGMPLSEPEELTIMTFGPAERADVILDVAKSDAQAVQIVLHENDTGYLLRELPVDGQRDGSRPAISALPANPIQPLSTLTGARTVPLMMEGGAMGGLRDGLYKGQKMTARELVQNGQVWTLNGQAGLPDTPLTKIELGAIVRIPIQNETAFAHAMHMHGTHFQEIFADGSFGPFKDTLLVERGQTREIAFLADNPGKWLLHCHMLSHQASGMKTWIEVV